MGVIALNDGIFAPSRCAGFTAIGDFVSVFFGSATSVFSVGSA